MFDNFIKAVKEKNLADLFSLAYDMKKYIYEQLEKLGLTGEITADDVLSFVVYSLTQTQKNFNLDDLHFIKSLAAKTLTKKHGVLANVMANYATCMELILKRRQYLENKISSSNNVNSSMDTLKKIDFALLKKGNSDPFTKELLFNPSNIPTENLKIYIHKAMNDFSSLPHENNKNCIRLYIHSHDNKQNSGSWAFKLYDQTGGQICDSSLHEALIKADILPKISAVLKEQEFPELTDDIKQKIICAVCLTYEETQINEIKLSLSDLHHYDINFFSLYFEIRTLFEDVDKIITTNKELIGAYSEILNENDVSDISIFEGLKIFISNFENRSKDICSYVSNLLNYKEPLLDYIKIESQLQLSVDVFAKKYKKHLSSFETRDSEFIKSIKNYKSCSKPLSQCKKYKISLLMSTKTNDELVLDDETIYVEINDKNQIIGYCIKKSQTTIKHNLEPPFSLEFPYENQNNLLIFKDTDYHRFLSILTENKHADDEVAQNTPQDFSLKNINNFLNSDSNNNDYLSKSINEINELYTRVPLDTSKGSYLQKPGVDVPSGFKEDLEKVYALSQKIDINLKLHTILTEIKQKLEPEGIMNHLIERRMQQINTVNTGTIKREHQWILNTNCHKKYVLLSNEKILSTLLNQKSLEQKNKGQIEEAFNSLLTEKKDVDFNHQESNHSSKDNQITIVQKTNDFLLDLKTTINSLRIKSFFKSSDERKLNAHLSELQKKLINYELNFQVYALSNAHSKKEISTPAFILGLKRIAFQNNPSFLDRFRGEYAHKRSFHDAVMTLAKGYSEAFKQQIRASAPPKKRGELLTNSYSRVFAETNQKGENKDDKTNIHKLKRLRDTTGICRITKSSKRLYKTLSWLNFWKSRQDNFDNKNHDLEIQLLEEEAILELMAKKCSDGKTNQSLDKSNKTNKRNTEEQTITLFGRHNITYKKI